MNKNKQVIFLYIALCCLFCDQLAKVLIDNFLGLNQKFILIPGFLSIEKVYNTGAAFSIFQDNTILLISISLITLILIFTFIFKSDSKSNNLDAIALAFITGGALGNLIDRFWHLKVIDFIQFEFIDFPIFNFADIFINIGVIILLISIFVYKNEQ